MTKTLPKLHSHFTAFAGLIYLLTAPLGLSADAITNVMSPVVSYQYFNSLSESGTTVNSPIVSYQYFEWPGDGILNLSSSPQVSYYYQFGVAPASVVLHGRVTDPNGLPLSGATVSALVYLSSVAQTTTDASGNYQLPLDTGVYDLWGRKSGYQTSIRAFTFGASTSEQNFQLKPMPAAPSVQETTRQPDLSATIGLMGSALRVFDGTQFQPITPANAPSTNRMTIILTHGWNSDPYVWAEGMAAQMWSKGVTTNIANILAWDWHTGASGYYAPEENTPSQGVDLGRALLGALHAGYIKPIHFIGHSLGALVNAAAANYLQGDRVAQQEISPTPWTVPVHITLLDETEAASLFSPVVVIFTGIRALRPNSSSVVPSFSDTFRWKGSMPVRSTWADNYISDLGNNHDNTVNVRLQISGSDVARHAYAHQWYRLTIENPSGCILGFRQSYEADQAQLSSFNSSAALAAFPLGVQYLRPFASADPLALTYKPTFTETIGSFSKHVVQGTATAVKFTGDVGVQIREGAQSAGEMILQGFNVVAAAAEQGSQSAVTFADSAVLQLRLSVSPISGRPGGVHTAGISSPPMAWLPIEFPSDATGMAFDFILTGDPGDDSLVCGIGTNKFFSLQAKYIPTNNPSSSPLIDVSLWAGTTNELFFGFLGGTSTNGSLSVENIRFYSLQPPRLSVQLLGNNAIVAWPNWASGYVLEASSNLAETNSWSAIATAPSEVGETLTVTNAIVTGNRFYRLRPF